MSSKSKKENPHVLIRDCRDRHYIIQKALFGEDGRGGMVADIAEIKSFVNGQKTKGRDWRALGFAVLGSVVTGVILLGVKLFLGA